MFLLLMEKNLEYLFLRDAKMKDSLGLKVKVCQFYNREDTEIYSSKFMLKYQKTLTKNK